ncbi:HAD family hydrolase, partial [Pelomicrobium sp. G1]
MLRVEIPDFATLDLAHLVLDYNGTLAVDGELLPGVRERLERLETALSIHVVTGDTFGTARARLRGVPCQLSILPSRGQMEE